MCNSLTLLDGTEIDNVGELVDAGIAPATIIDVANQIRMYVPNPEIAARFDCLCGIDVPDLMGQAGRPCTSGPWGYYEADRDGRTFQDAYIEDEERTAEHLAEGGNLDHIRFVKVDPNWPYRKESSK